MGIVFGLLLAGALVWSYVRVISRKRYATHQSQAPDLNRFAEGSVEAAPGAHRI